MVGVVEVTVEQEKALVVEGEDDSGGLQSLVLLLGDVDGVALELAGQTADLGGVVGFPKLRAQAAALLAEGDEDGGGVVVDELEVAGGGLEAEVEEVAGVVKAAGEVIEDDAGTRDAVEFAAAGSAVGVEGLEELDVGGDDDAGVPVFGGEAVSRGLVFRVGIEIRVVLENDVGTESGERFAEDAGVLLDDGGEGDDVDDGYFLIS